MGPLASSRDLHPDSGARFVFERYGDGYRVEVYLPDGEHAAGMLAWDATARASLEPALTPEWVHEEALKLARVLKRDPRPKLLRWRPGP